MRKILDEVMADPKRRPSLERRFWPKVDRSGGPDACWPWIAKATHPYGYGRMTSGRRAHIKAHQIAFALANGPIGEAWIRHSCDNPACCNPAHLLIGTAKDNTGDSITRGRHKPPPLHIGDTHPNAKLTTTQIRLIEIDHRPVKVLAAEYGVSEKTIYYVWGRKARLEQVQP